jgi:hypothetical protein
MEDASGGAGSGLGGALAQPWEIMAALTHQSSPSFPRSPHNGPHGSKPWWTADENPATPPS